MSEESSQELIANKNFFNTLEIASLLEIKPHVIRYWESEFNEIRPQKNKHGQRLYRREDVMLFFSIKHLLCDKKFTIAGARKMLRSKDTSSIINDNLPSFVSGNENENILHSQAENTLEEALMHLPNIDISFDVLTQEIHEQCEDLIRDEMLIKESILDEIDYEKAIITMQTSKETLLKVLEDLNKPSSEVWAQWEEFKS